MLSGPLLLAEPAEAVYARVDAYITERMRQAGVPGAAFAVISNDTIVHFRGIGAADPEGRSIERQTPFGIGSVSKSFGALAAMQLVEAGKLDLDVPVQRYLPNFQTTDPIASARITVRHLLHHQSGLPTFVNHADCGARHDPTEALNRAIKFMAKVHLKDPPGQAFRYSDPGYVVLAAVVQEVSGRPFEQYLKEAVFAPLRMQHSFTSEIEAMKDGAATGYRYWFGNAIPHKGLSSCYFDPLAGGGLYCSAEDLAKYLIVHMSNGRSGNTRILSEAGFERLHKPEVQMNGWMHYAMGWMIISKRAEWPLMIAHSGITPKYLAYATMIPDQHIGFALLFNSNARGDCLENIEFDVARMLVGMAPLQKTRSSIRTSLLQRIECAFTVLLMATVVARAVWRLYRPRMHVSADRPGRKWRIIRSGVALLLCLAGLYKLRECFFGEVV